MEQEKGTWDERECGGMAGSWRKGGKDWQKTGMMDGWLEGHFDRRDGWMDRWIDG